MRSCNLSMSSQASFRSQIIRLFLTNCWKSFIFFFFYGTLCSAFFQMYFLTTPLHTTKKWTFHDFDIPASLHTTKNWKFHKFDTPAPLHTTKKWNFISSKSVCFNSAQVTVNTCVSIQTMCVTFGSKSSHVRYLRSSPPPHFKHLFPNCNHYLLLTISFGKQKFLSMFVHSFQESNP